MADGVRGVLGDGESLGIRLRYIEEPEPLGTGGALKFAEDLLDERFFMLNGDVLTDIDLTAELAQHERTGARATLALIRSRTRRPTGWCRCNSDDAVAEFVEKPGAEQIETDLINAGAYIIERRVLDGMAPAGTNISIEREVFPTLVGRGAATAIRPMATGWTSARPSATCRPRSTSSRATSAPRSAGGSVRPGGRSSDGADVEGRVVAPALVGAG